MKRNKFPENLAAWTLTGAIVAAAAIAALAPPLGVTTETAETTETPPDLEPIHACLRLIAPIRDPVPAS